MKDNITESGIKLQTGFSIEVNESAESLVVLIKHDYYSSDNDNGRMILDSFLDGLIMTADRIKMILITDSAVKLLGTSDKLNDLIKVVRLTMVCDDSIRFYNASVPDPVKDMIRTVSSSDITDQIIESRPDIIIE